MEFLDSLHRYDLRTSCNEMVTAPNKAKSSLQSLQVHLNGYDLEHIFTSFIQRKIHVKINVGLESQVLALSTAFRVTPEVQAKSTNGTFLTPSWSSLPLMLHDATRDRPLLLSRQRRAEKRPTNAPR